MRCCCRLQRCSHLPEDVGLRDQADVRGRTPLHYCVALEAHAVAHLLVSRGASRQALDQAGATPLDLAIARGRIHDERLLVRLSSIGLGSGHGPHPAPLTR